MPMWERAQSTVRQLAVTALAVVLAATLLPCAAMAAGPSSLQSGRESGDALSAQSAPMQVQASSKAAKNKKAHAVYMKKLAALDKKQGGFSPSYRFIDLTNDGIDEMVVGWWPSIYTFRGGKAVRVDSRDIGSANYTKAYKKKKVVLYTESDHYGSLLYCYLKWNGKKFVLQAVKYTPGSAARSVGYKPHYWQKGKGTITKKQVNAYIKKLTGNTKATKLGYSTYKKF